MLPAQIAVGGLVATGAGQQRAEPQQIDLAVHHLAVRGGGEPLDRGLGFLQIGLAAAGQQRLDEHAGGRDAPGELSCLEQVVHGCPQRRDGTIEVSTPGLLPGDESLDHRYLG